MKRIGIIVCLLVVSMLSYAAKDKSKTVRTVIRSWQLPLPTQQADTQRVDTSMLNMPMRDMLNDYSISNCWNGNTVSPVQSRIYFARTNLVDDIFAHQYEPFLITGQNVHFYNTTVPYSRVAYSRGFTNEHEEHEINFLMTGNLNKKLNLGLQLNYLTSPGHYLTQEAKLFNGAAFGSYNGNHYSLQAAIAWNNISNFENGGIQNDSDLIGPLNSEDIPVRMKGMSGYSNISAILNHYYSITVERQRHDSIEVTNGLGEKEKKDTVRIEYIPVTTFAHTFTCDNSVRRYIEEDYKGHNDSSNVLTIRNTLCVTFEEEFNRILKFGAKVYAVNECQRFETRDDTLFHDKWTNNTFVGGELYKNQGKWVHYGFDGEVCVLGYKLGQFQVNGHVDGDFRLGKDTMHISAKVYVKNETPAYYLQHYHSHHLDWDNDFSKTYRYFVGGEIAYPTQWVKPSVQVGFENLQNYIYFATDGLPQQYKGHIQVISANAHLDITTPWVNLENNVVYQHSTSKFMPLPDITLYHNLYYHGTWFKAMQAQIGADVRYHTRYYAPVLVPTIGQFAIQDEYKIGNYPILNVYANFYVKLIHLKFFAQYTHLNRLFMGSYNNNLIMPHYPYNPGIFRVGLAWHFYR